MPKKKQVTAKEIVKQAFLGVRSADGVHALLKRRRIKGVRSNVAECPVALLLKRLAPKGTYIEVGQVTEFGFPDGRSEKVRLPKAAINFIWRFDEGTHYQDRRAE